MPVRLISAVVLAASLSTASAAKPGEEIDNLIQAFYRDRPGAATTVQALVKVMAEKPEDPGCPKAFAWLMRHAGATPESDFDMNEKFLKRLEKHHRDNDDLAPALLTMIGHREPDTIAFFERLGEGSKSDLVSGSALLALASSFEHDSDEIERYDRALETLIKKYPELKYGGRDITAYAKQKLYASKNLRVGMVAPEVEGEDAEGKRFKLSDYRGKVVFFNFWGDW